jgi:hypothetical protein
MHFQLTKASTPFTLSGPCARVVLLTSPGFFGGMMPLRSSFSLPAVIAVSLCLASAAYAAAPEDELAGDVKLVLARSFNTDWSGLETLRGIKWAPLPPTMLQNCLPDGGCFTRQGSMAIAGKSLMVLATGARTIVSHLYFRNAGTPIGEAAVLEAIKRAGLSADLARCPVSGGTGGTNWYRLKSASSNPGVLAIQSSCNGKPCEGFTLTQGAELPPLQPNQLRLYSEQCSAGPDARKPVSTVMPHEQLARTIAALLPPSVGAAFYDWKTLPTLLPTAQWPSGGPNKTPDKTDPNPFTMSGQMTLSGRTFYLTARGLASAVKIISFDEAGMHPSGENVMGEVYKQGYAVRLVRCGPVYTQSINNWYSVTSAKSRPAMVRQSIRYEGKQVQDTYELRLDGTLPTRDPRDRDPGVSGCR